MISSEDFQFISKFDNATSDMRQALLQEQQNKHQVSQVMRKCVLCHMRTTKAQISLRICTVFAAGISLVSRSEISRSQLVSVAEQAGLNVTWSQTLEDTF